MLAVRCQYSIKLAFALTVHRAHGQTKDKIEIDCYSFFAAGQLGVALFSHHGVCTRLFLIQSAKAMA